MVKPSGDEARILRSQHMGQIAMTFMKRELRGKDKGGTEFTKILI
jgi:hypothetical protein